MIAKLLTRLIPNTKEIKAALCLTVLFFFLNSCQQSEIDQPVIPSVNMSLPDLEVGDVFFYILLEGESYIDQDNFNFKYTGDTLKVEVIGKENDKYVVSESITLHSNMMESEINYYSNKNLVYSSYWSFRNNFLVLEIIVHELSGSHLFFGLTTYYSTNYFSGQFDNILLTLQEFNENEVSIKGWKTTSGPLWDCTVGLFTKSFSLLGIHYERANVAVFNCAMNVDGNGQTYVYNRENLIIRTSSYEERSSKGLGWDRIK